MMCVAPIGAVAVTHVPGDAGSDPDAQRLRTRFDPLPGRERSLGLTDPCAHAAASSSTSSIRSP